MAVETRREKLFYYGLVPIIAAVLGALAASMYASSTGGIDQDQLHAILTDVKMTGAQKLEALKIYKEVSDRPWGLLRSLIGILAVSVGLFAVDIGRRIRGH